MCVNLCSSRLMLLKQVFPRENTIIKISTKSKTCKNDIRKIYKKKEKWWKWKDTKTTKNHSNSVYNYSNLDKEASVLWNSVNEGK